MIEQLEYNLLFRWFVGLGMDERIWDHSTFSKNRDRLLEATIARRFCEDVPRADAQRLLSDEHSRGRPSLQAWASYKVFGARTMPATDAGESNPTRRFSARAAPNDTRS